MNMEVVREKWAKCPNCGQSMFVYRLDGMILYAWCRDSCGKFFIERKKKKEINSKFFSCKTV